MPDKPPHSVQDDLLELRGRIADVEAAVTKLLERPVELPPAPAATYLTRDEAIDALMTGLIWGLVALAVLALLK